MANRRAGAAEKRKLSIAGASTATVSAWEDDPGSGVRVTRPVPNLAAKPLAFAFPKPAPPAGMYQPGTADFRYWTAAEALRRGADFWAKRVPLSRWEVGQVLKVILDEGVDLNAYYDRKALNFFHGPSHTGTVYSGESPDIVCHEMGHAVLDSFKPQLWGAASHEAAAFHESFADMSAILSALQLPSVRNAILTDTGGHLYHSSRLSRLAEQLGAAIRAQQPDAVDPDCLRNAVNSFTYLNPVHLPQSAPASQLSSEPHSFSRVFTGAFFESLAGMVAATAANQNAPTENELASVANDLAGIVVAGVKAAPVVSNWYAEVAAAMVRAAAAVKAAYVPVLKATFVRRSILSMHAASATETLQKSIAAAGAATRTASEPLDSVALTASQYGLDKPLLVQTPSQSRAFLATSAAPDASPIEPDSAVTAARAFVDDLFRQGRVDYNKVGRPEMRLEQRRRLRTHRLVEESSVVRLERLLFDCGLCRR